MRNRLFYGAAIDNHLIASDATLMTHVIAECGVVCGGTGFSWAELQPKRDWFHFDRAEIVAAFAARHALHIRGRALVSHKGNPEWLDAALADAEAPDAESLLTTHIAAVAGRFRQRITQWDVASDVLEPTDGKPHDLRNTPWLRRLGPGYVALAFEATATADPTALRVLSDHGLDYAAPEDNRRRAAMLDLLAFLTASGAPVQALGLQGHLQAARRDLDQRVLAEFVSDVASLGLAIVITEMDVRDNGLPAEIGARDAAVAAHGRAYLDAVLSHPAALGVCTSGLSDRRTWLNEAHPRKDGLPQRPLPLDWELERKPLWAAMARAFETAPARDNV
jgi:endo-1,4-beta-xylanase